MGVDQPVPERDERWQLHASAVATGDREWRLLGDAPATLTMTGDNSATAWRRTDDARQAVATL